ncbi:MAG: endonuclease MutS2, partial [Muribaculaceae bacterium]|nr:endonuclease MutS2 [Muribaculaceae bacterium]
MRAAVAERCLTAHGREFAAEAIAFSSDFGAVRSALEATAEMLTIITSGADDLPLGRVGDIRRALLAVRIDGTFLAVDDLAATRNALNAFGTIAAFFADGERAALYPRLAAVASTLGGFPELVRMIDRVVDRYGNVLDSASPELADIRRELSRAQGSIAAAMRRVMAQAVAQGYVEADATPSVRDGRMVLP